MASNIDQYEKDLKDLSSRGGALVLAMKQEFDSKNSAKANDKNKLPNVNSEYQKWYSEALALITQVLPERVDDFKSYYSPNTNRKELLFSNYTISDYLRGTTVTLGAKTIVGPSAALGPMYQQYNIISGLEQRFKSRLFDIHTLVQADLLDDELHAAEELNAKGFHRGAGAIAGVVLEAHLSALCQRNNLTFRKKSPTISDFNDALKTASVIETATWRFIQHLGDLRNKCDHKKQSDPTKDEVNELIEGARKITKTVL